MNTLKTQHTKKRLRRLQERLVEADRRITEEQHADKRFGLLLEEMNEEDLQQVSGIINKLRTIQSQAQGSGALAEIIDNVLMDLQKITGGEKSLGQAALGVIGKGDNAKVFKNAMALVSSLESAFRLMPQLLKNMLGPVKGGSDQSKKTVAQLLMGEGIIREAPDGNPQAQPGNDPNVETKNTSNSEANGPNKGAEKLALITQNIVKAMKPSKWLGLISKKLPYVQDPETLVTDILNSVPVGNLMRIIQTMTGGPQAASLAQDIAGPGQGGESRASAATDPSNVSNSTSETERTSGVGEPRASGQGGVSQEWIDDFSTHIEQKTGVDHDSIVKIMMVLSQNGKLRESSKRSIRPAAAVALLGELARSGRLAEAVDAGVITIQLDHSDITDLTRE